MKTHCSTKKLSFQPLGKRRVEGAFDGGTITSDGGGLLLREVEGQCRILSRLAECFQDFRRPECIEHSLEDLVKQRVFALCLGYEDLNDHETLRSDHLLAIMVGNEEPEGKKRKRDRDKGVPLAGKSTLNRLENVAPDTAGRNRYHRFVPDFGAIDRLLIRLFIESHETPPEALVLDIDATDTALHGTQEGRFFHGYYGHHCSLPLLITCDEHILFSRLRPANIDAAKGSVEALSMIVSQLRAVWPDIPIVIRGDSGFCRDDLMTWCEANDVDYVIGLAKNERVKTALKEAMDEARNEFDCTGRAARRFVDFRYQTLTSWSCERRVVGKAEYLSKGENPRFVVTSIDSDLYAARELYEQGYCPRGDMENRIKEHQLDMFGDRMSAHEMGSNQLRFYWSVFAYTLLISLKRLALAGTELANAYVGTIRLKLLKIGSKVQVSVRRIKLSLASECPFQELFFLASQRLRAGPTAS